ncbi:MAG: hydroxyacid dehydrogenase [Deltaproteobacteria bacterium]|jgi:phosphoglycerate dehydrogenase-like enzyme|nr:hydroxyacid dehydrogenase [Deltaproteobacteria bacterium]
MIPSLLVTYLPKKETREYFKEIIGDLAHIVFLPEKDNSKRIRLLENADVIVALSFAAKEIDSREVAHLKKLAFIQLVFAGADGIPFDRIPQEVIIASNAGAFAEPIAEHVLALVLALAKNIIPYHSILAAGRFDRPLYNQELKGGVCAIIGFGGNGKAIAGLMQALGMKVFGINRSGTTDVPVDFIGRVSDLREVLPQSDVVVVTTPLNRETRDLIGREELGWMKADAILINVGRGAIINQQALYEHLKTHPNFRAGIDTWWSEPADRGRLKLDFPFFELPNITGSTHCADYIPGAIARATERALKNVKRFLLGQEIRGVLDRNDYIE